MKERGLYNEVLPEEEKKAVHVKATSQSPDRTEARSNSNPRKPFNLFGSKKDKKSVADPFGVKKSANFNSIEREEKHASQIRDEAPAQKPKGVGLSI